MAKDACPALVLCEIVVALESLEPSTDFDLVASEGPVDVSSTVKKIAATASLLPTLPPAPVICDAPFEAVEPDTK